MFADITELQWEEYVHLYNRGKCIVSLLPMQCIITWQMLVVKWKVTLGFHCDLAAAMITKRTESLCQFQYKQAIKNG